MPNIEVTAEVATEIHRLHGRIAELERQVQEAHAELGLASQTDVQARLHARVVDLEAVILAAHDELMGEFWNCPICGHAETASDMDVMECHLKATAEKIRASKR